MKKVRGMTAQEKQKAILDIFFETRDVFNKDEIEKEAKKKKVNNPFEVQDIVKLLVQDNLINKDKVGSGSFFWSFPNEKKLEMEKVLSNLDTKMQQTQQKIDEINSKITTETSARSSENRAELEAKFSELRAKCDKKAKQVAILQKSDPVRIAELRKKIEEFRKLANLWTENIETMLFFVKKKFFMSMQDLNRYKESQEIDADLELIETA